jgi:hypothetical protein
MSGNCYCLQTLMQLIIIIVFCYFIVLHKNFWINSVFFLLKFVEYELKDLQGLFFFLSGISFSYVHDQLQNFRCLAPIFSGTNLYINFLRRLFYSLQCKTPQQICIFFEYQLTRCIQDSVLRGASLTPTSQPQVFVIL